MKELKMDLKLNKMKPAVDKKILIFLSFLMWFIVGLMLLSYANAWLRPFEISRIYLFIILGFCLALVIHHFGFLKIVDKNVQRLLAMEGKKCLFAFFPWKSYAIIIVMVIMGILLRHSAIPKTYLAIIYIGIGLSLILSSFRYLRFFLYQARRPD